MDIIYYCYSKANGAFGGSGVTDIDTADWASTITPLPDTIDPDTAIWDGTAWSGQPPSASA